ncbi:MAG: SAM-dependent methyltransferase [Mycobacterium sp.]|nr:SAM-dependent methyltransferase [Mycobacterium sp.]
MNSLVTPECDTALRACRSIFTLHFDEHVVEQLGARYENVTSLDDHYGEGKPRRETYTEVASIVLEAARTNRPAAFVTYGHPWVFVRPTALLVAEAPQHGLKVKVLPGISAFDTLFVDLQFDPGESGLQAFEATDVLLRHRTLAPDVPCLIWQIGATGTTTYEKQMTDEASIAELATYLQKFYPATHHVTVARSAATPLGSPHLVTSDLESLPKLADELRAADTLYIPAVSP